MMEAKLPPLQKIRLRQTMEEKLFQILYLEKFHVSCLQFFCNYVGGSEKEGGVQTTPLTSTHQHKPYRNEWEILIIFPRLPILVTS